MTTRLTWDEAKNRSNQRKHDGIAFEVAARVFLDPLRLTRLDRIEGGEERWQTIGVVHGITVLLVAHTVTEDASEGEAVEVIRIISARRATPRERKHYEHENRQLHAGHAAPADRRAAAASGGACHPAG